MRLYGSIEAGGTWMKCAIGDENASIMDSIVIPVTKRDETIGKMLEYFEDKDIAALGIACFGPLDLNPDSETYGYITKTPKIGWENVNIKGIFEDKLKVPVVLDTDVNGALLGEVMHGAGKGYKDVVYITIGTGIGAGIYSGGNLVHGMLHPEAGHIILKSARGDHYKGKCPFHNYCFEGLASGPAIEDRWGQKGETLSDKEEVWEIESEYIAQALVNYIMILSPKKIILGGGVMNQEVLWPLIREKTLEMINGYIDTRELRDIDNYIVPASLGGNQGLVGGLELAKTAIV